VPTSRQLRARIAGLPRRKRSFQVWRAVRPAYELLGTHGSRLHGGRWNPPGLRVLYASLEPRTVRAEWVRAMERQGLPESAAYPLRLGLIAVRGPAVDLRRRGALDSLGVDEPPTVLTGLEATRAAGAAAAAEGVGAIVVPSVTGAGANLVIVPDNLDSPAEVLEATLLRGPRAWP
jgi:RES domain-containing protein